MQIVDRKDAKYKNVMQLAREYVPKSDMPFYDTLNSDAVVRENDISETEDENDFD